GNSGSNFPKSYSKPRLPENATTSTVMAMPAKVMVRLNGYRCGASMMGADSSFSLDRIHPYRSARVIMDGITKVMHNQAKMIPMVEMNPNSLNPRKSANTSTNREAAVVSALVMTAAPVES